VTPFQYIQENISDLEFLSKPERKELLKIASKGFRKHNVTGGRINKYLCDGEINNKKIVIEINEFNGSFHGWIRCVNLAQNKTINMAV